MHNAGMICSYARASTDTQNLTTQVARLKAARCARIFREKTSGATAERPQLKNLMAIFAPGDVVEIVAVEVEPHPESETLDSLPQPTLTAWELN
jgi:predicted site-specific integrase-resolvase